MKHFINLVLSAMIAVVSVSCNFLDLDGLFGQDDPIDPITGIPTDETASEVPSPSVSDEDKTFTMPTSISPLSIDPDNEKIGRFNLAGINANGEWLELYGTGEVNQNVWLKINGKEKGIKVYNGDEVSTRAVSRSMADVVFLVDNSGSMAEEANKVAEEIIRWSEKLSQTMDVKFGCVGIDHKYINGAINITDVNTLSQYLNVYTGVNRTQHYGENMTTPPSDLETMKFKARAYNDAGGECGGIMLHFADQNFSFRENANRFYVYFTDEPNQPGNNSWWSVLSVDSASEYYNWNSSKGVIYTVFSDQSAAPENWTSWLTQENPYLFSTYTGGATLTTSSSFNISLDELPVTGAITQSFVFTFNIDESMIVGEKYDVDITIYQKDGLVASHQVYKAIEYKAAE